MREIVFQNNDKVEWMDDRYYKVSDDIYVPSVTTILNAFPKPYALMEWLKKNGENADEIRDAAGESGSKVHFAIELYDKGIDICWADPDGNAQYSILEWQMINRFVEFADKTKYELISNEVSYGSSKLKYGGTLDKVCTFGGKTWLIDNKTSNAIYDSYWLQLVAYKYLWDEFNPNIPIDEIAILHLKAQTRTEGKGKDIQGKGWKLYLPEKPIEYYWKLFQATYQLWLSQNPDSKPLNRVYPAIIRKRVEVVSA